MMIQEVLREDASVPGIDGEETILDGAPAALMRRLFQVLSFRIWSSSTRKTMTMTLKQTFSQ